MQRPLLREEGQVARGGEFQPPREGVAAERRHGRTGLRRIAEHTRGTGPLSP